MDTRKLMHDAAGRDPHKWPAWADPTALHPPRPRATPRRTTPPIGLTPACEGDPLMWESEDPELISWAVSACGLCPVADWCQNERNRLVTAGMDLVGVWAGQVYPASGGE